MTKPTLAEMAEDELTDMSLPLVRCAAVARGRALVKAHDWSHADEVASELVDCLVAQRMP